MLLNVFDFVKYKGFKQLTFFFDEEDVNIELRQNTLRLDLISLEELSNNTFKMLYLECFTQYIWNGRWKKWIKKEKDKSF